MSKKYYYFNDIKWATEALALHFDCKPEDVGGILEKKAAAKKRGPIPTAAETRKIVAAAMESAPSEVVEVAPLLQDTDGTEIVIEHVNGNHGTFDDVDAAALFLDCKESQVVAALSRGSWKARKIALIVRRAVA